MTLSRRNDIDGLRALAVVSVVLYHAFNDLLKGGFVGVDVFFVISGYVITRLIYAEMQQSTFSFLQFYMRRVRRLYPALLVVLTFILFAGWFIFLADEYEKMAKIAASQFVYLNNFMNALNTTYFDSSAEEHPLTHLWSLAVEEQFYLVWPLLLFVCLKQKLNPKIVLLVLMVASFGVGLFFLKLNHNFAFYLPFGRFYEMMVGAFIAFEERNPSIHPKWQEKYGDLIFLSGLSFVLYACFFIKSSESFPGFPVLLPVFGTALIIYAGAFSKLNQLLFANKFMVGIGLISYPLYLWHWPLFSLQFISQGQVIEPWLRWAMVVLSFILAYFTYILLEKPLQKRDLKATSLLLYLLMAGVAAFSVSIIMNKGYLSRPVLASSNPNIKELNQEFTLNHDGILTCRSYFGLKMKGYKCIAPPDTSTPPVLLIGDSTASALHKAALTQIPHLQLFWRASCPPHVIRNLKGEVRWEYAICESFSNDLTPYFAQNKQAKAVVLHSRLPAKFSIETDLDAQELEFAKNYELKAQTKFEVAYFNSFRLFLARLKREVGDKKIIVIYANPEFDRFAKTCLNRPLRVVNALPQACEMSKEAHEERYAYYRRVLGALEKVYPEITFIKTEHHFCNEKGCSFIQNNRLTYVDDIHLTPSGVAPIIKDLLKELSVLKP